MGSVAECACMHEHCWKEQNPQRKEDRVAAFPLQAHPRYQLSAALLGFASSQAGMTLSRTQGGLWRLVLETVAMKRACHNSVPRLEGGQSPSHRWWLEMGEDAGICAWAPTYIIHACYSGPSPPPDCWFLYLFRSCLADGEGVSPL